MTRITLPRYRWAPMLGLCAVLLCLALPVWAADTKAPAAKPNAAAPVVTPEPAAGTEPHNSEALWREVRSGMPGVTTIGGPEGGVLVDPAGNTWRQIRNGPLTFYGGILIVLVAAAIFFFHRRKGTFELSEKPTGRVVVRFTNWERAIHWLVAVSFICLALTGLTLLFGKYVVLPVIGFTLFSWLAGFAKNFHNFLGFLFAASLALMIVTFVRDNFWHPSDARWIRQAGGLMSRAHVPSGRFNFGEKAWFWGGVCLLGLTAIASGLVLVFPNYFDTRGAMRIAEVVHAIAAVLIVAMSFGHIYLGTLGVAGAYEAMLRGEVDETWAKEHHELWYREMIAKRGKIAKRGQTK